MKLELAAETVRAWLINNPPEGDFHYTKILDGMVSPESLPHLRKIIFDLVRERKLKHMSRGYYRIIRQVEPVKWKEADESEFFDLNFPYGHEDESRFLFFDKVKLSPGGLMVIAGTSNSGKSVLARNLLAENIFVHPIVVMGNEFVNLDGRPDPKFKRCMMRMKWIDWTNGETPDFDILPVKHDYEDYIQPNKLNIIDWLNMPGEWNLMSRVLDNIKSSLGSGFAIVVLQKKHDTNYGYGAEATEQFADLYLTIDQINDSESRLNVGKVKERMGSFHRIWGFNIIDYGANLHGIKEMIKCSDCRSTGWGKSGVCERCNGAKFVYKDM